MFYFLARPIYSHHSIKRTGSIKRPGFEFYKKSLLNVPYDRKKEGVNILSYRSYNRVVRVGRPNSLHAIKIL